MQLWENRLIVCIRNQNQVFTSPKFYIAIPGAPTCKASAAISLVNSLATMGLTGSIRPTCIPAGSGNHEDESETMGKLATGRRSAYAYLLRQDNDAGLHVGVEAAVVVDGSRRCHLHRG